MAKKSKKRKSSFRGKIKANAASRQADNQFGYIIIPDGLSVFVPEPNTKVVMDIVPYEVKNPKHKDRNDDEEIAVPGTDWFKLPFSTHSVGAGNERHREICLQTFGKKCPVCEDWSAEKRKGELDEEDIAQMKPSKRNLYAIIVRSITTTKGRKSSTEKIKDPKVELFEFSDWLFQNVFEKQLEDEEEFEYFPDLYEGVSIKVVFGEGAYQGNKYPEPTRFDFVERKDAEIEEDLIETIPCLDECLSILSYKALEEKHQVTESEDEDEDEEEERPRKKKGRKAVEEEEDEDYGEDEEEEEDDDEEEEEEDDEPAPRKKRKTTKKKRKVVEEEEEDEDEDDEDEDEEPAPRKKKTSKSKKKSKKECPEGYEFGEDFNSYEDCDDCKIWKLCKAAK